MPKVLKMVHVCGPGMEKAQEKSASSRGKEREKARVARMISFKGWGRFCNGDC